MIYLLVWLFFAVVSAVVASNKGRSGIGWFVLGFLFGPFAFILVLVLSNLNVKREGKAIASAAAKLVKCPHCAELVQPEAKKCKHCMEAI